MSQSKMKQHFLLENRSSASICYNSDYCKEIKLAKQPMETQTNSGSMIASKSYDIPNMGEAYCHPNKITNVIGCQNMRKI